MSEREQERRFISHMTDGRPTVGFDDGAEIFDTEADAARASWLLHQAFRIAYASIDQRLLDGNPDSKEPNHA